MSQDTEDGPTPLTLEEQIRQESYRANEYREAWHKAEAERDAAFEEGVAEGLRQAREVVQVLYDDDSPIEPPQYWAGLSSALHAIDEVEADHA